MPGPGSVACPKPKKGRLAKKARDRLEPAIVKAVRKLVDERDGYCRLHWTNRSATGRLLLAFFGTCSGPSEWCHVEEKRRGKTRGQAPEERHTTQGSVKFCRQHHQGKGGYDLHGFRITYLTARGCDGPLRYVKSSGDFLDEPDADS